MQTDRKSSTCLARGAPPLTISLTRPPSRCLSLEKTSLSKKGAARDSSMPARRAHSLRLNPQWKSRALSPPASAILAVAPE